MIKSESIIKIAPAFLKAQKEMEAVIKDAKNPFFKSEYATLNAVMEACKKPLNDNGLSIMQPVSGEYVETVIMHESGEFFACQTLLMVKENNNPQALGSAISYARRYGLMSMLGLPAEDDDGESAMVRSAPVAKTAPVKKQQETLDIDEILNEADGGLAPCTTCGRPVSEASEAYSLKNFNKILCMPCQAKERAKGN